MFVEVPQSIGKTGFTASCAPLLNRKDGQPASTCDLHSPFANRSHAEAMRKLLLTKPHLWDGKLSISQKVCKGSRIVRANSAWEKAEEPMLPRILVVTLINFVRQMSSAGHPFFDLKF